MSTATMSRTDALKQIGLLQVEAEELQKNFDDKMSEIAGKMSEAVGAISNVNGSAAHVPSGGGGPSVKRRGGRPPKSAVARVVKQAGKVAPNQRNYNNEMSLREAIWDVLSRSTRAWAQHIDGLPTNVSGLQINEIKEIIEKEQKWVSSSANISPQVQSQVYNLKEEGKISRGDDRRYYIVRGATLDSPAKVKKGKKK